MAEFLKGLDGGALRFGLALRLEQRIISTTNVSHQLLVPLLVGLAAQIFVQSLLSDAQTNSGNLSKRLRERNRRHRDGTSGGVQVDVAARNRAGRRKCAQLAGFDREIERRQKFCSEQIGVKTGKQRCASFGRGFPLLVDFELGPLVFTIVGSRQFDRLIQGEYVLGSLLPWRRQRERQ